MADGKKPQRQNSLANRRKKTINLVCNLGEGLLRAKHAIHEAATARGWNVLDASLIGDILPPGYTPHLAILTLGSYDPLCRELMDRGVHIVRQGALRHPSDDDVIPAVLADRKAEGRMAAEHYAERGFRHVGIAHYGHASEYDMAFHNHATRLGCQFHDVDLSRPRSRRKLSSSELFEQEGNRFREWIARVPHPIGLLQRSDTMAARFSLFCAQGGLEIPTQVALLGRGNDPAVCDFAPVRLSSIHLDTEGRIDTCIRLLENMLAGRKIKIAPVMIPPKSIVTRESTDVHASQNPDVAKALRYMWENFDDSGLSVDVIAQVAGFSRRKLERLFRTELDKTVNEALLERRLERCCEYLITTDINASDLYEQVGLRSRSYLCRVFKNTYGMTLKQYREENGNAVVSPSHSPSL